VAAGHHLAAEIGARMLAGGGNAADAACAMGFALQVLEPTQNGPGGECPILYYEAASERVYAISGQGPAPAAATLAAMRERGIDLIPPDGFLAATVPAALDAWCALLERFGTRSLEQVLAPAQGLAARGFPMYPFLRDLLALVEPRFRAEWPTSAALFSPVPPDGAPLANAELAGFLDELARAEREARGSREARIRAARDHFYRGPAAERIEAFLRTPVRDATGRAHAGLLTAQDLARYAGSIEEPVARAYRGARVWKCPPWSQGPVFLQQLALLEGFDLAALGRGSADALHLWIECAKLAFADREACYADPRFAEVPLERLLSPDYAAARRRLVDPEQASLELRPGIGRLPAGWPLVEPCLGPAEPVEPQALAAAGRGEAERRRAPATQGREAAAQRGEAERRRAPATQGREAAAQRGEAERRRAPATQGREAAAQRGEAERRRRTDTTHCVAVDRSGNLVSATPSGGWIPTSPVVPGLGFPVGTRAQMFVLDPDHPNALAPGKRPRTTLSPSLARLPDGRLLAFGTPGGDQQDQWTLHFFLDCVDFGVRDLQQAIDAPTLHVEHAPSSFYPRRAEPGVVAAEERIDPRVLAELEARGHRVRRVDGWSHGRVLAAAFDPASGLCEAAASPRFQVAYAIAIA
jgi:gamma-glutamyltranspeptidase/glutathione hydrolase